MRTYDPLTIEELGRNAARALMAYPSAPLPPAAFTGVGVYTIHYQGDFNAYAGLGETPIYVGKADSQGAQVLHNRLTQHTRSIDQAANLLLEDFDCRWLVLAPVWVGMTEQILIDQYRPVWNLAITGFGNHDPGRGRRAQRRSEWDTLHPGRPWAASLQDIDGGRDAVLAAIQRHRTG